MLYPESPQNPIPMYPGLCFTFEFWRCGGLGPDSVTVFSD